MRIFLLLAVLFGLGLYAISPVTPRAAGGASSTMFAGVPQVIDGDGLSIDGRSLRLHGLDAPEIGQECVGGAQAPVSGPFDCGAWARDALTQRIAGAQVTCLQMDLDRYDRPVVRCDLNGANLNEALVREGYALAYRRYSTDYAAAEDDARSARAGLWSVTMQTPEAFRRAGASPATRPATSSDPGCVIKGNISDNGLIYHLPTQENYARTRINSARGERWFCSEAEAVAAGWRAARR